MGEQEIIDDFSTKTISCIATENRFAKIKEFRAIIKNNENSHFQNESPKPFFTIYFNFIDLILFEDNIEHNMLNGYIIEGNIPNKYTGIKDKNGKMIYEGDIVKFMVLRNIGMIIEMIFVEEECTGEIYWDNKVSSYEIKSKENGNYVRCIELEETIEVIGNIYENPELL